MGKSLIEIGAVIAGVALIATGIGAAAGAGLLGAEAAAVAGASAGTLTLFGVSTTTLLEVGAAVATVGELMIKPKLTGAGSAQQFKADTNAPIPCTAGRFGVGGNAIYETTSGGSNKAKAGAAGNEYLTQCVILSGLGPIKAVETLKFNDTILKWNGEDCSGGYIPTATIGSYNVPYKNNNDGTYENDQYNDHAWHNVQLGVVPTPYFAYPSKLNTESDAPLPEWDASHGLSGFAADFLTIVYDQTVYTGGMPKPLWTLSGYSVYDPRQDSTYPGGAPNGPQRWSGLGATAVSQLGARGTWAWSENPYIHALNFALGFFLPDGATQLGALYAGGGVPWRGVDIDQFIACANIADANGWTIGMQWTTDDDPWSVLTTMLQAGGGQPIDRDGRISCIINAPLTSLGTITNDDLQGSVSVDTTTALRDKLNRVYPRFHSEPHDWAMVPVTTPITGASYLAEDGRVIAKQLDYEGVTQVNQACQLAAYDLANSREGIVATLPCKLTAANYRVGDCITVDVDVANLTNLKMVVIKRSPDFQTGAITLTCRSETDAKHPFAMGVSGVAPPTPTITGVDPSYVGAPLPDFWATGLLEQTDAATGEGRSVISVIGSSADNVYAQTVLLRWRLVTVNGATITPVGDGQWSEKSVSAATGNYELDLNPGTYDVQIAYVTIQGAGPSDDTAWLDLGVETVGGSTSSSTASVPGTAIVGDRLASTLTQQIDNAAQTLSDLTGTNGTIDQINAQLDALEQGGGDGGAGAAEQGAQAAEQGALSARDLAYQYQGEAEGYANSASQSEGLATQAANGAGNSAYQASQSAGSSADSATAAANFSLEAQTTGAATLPSTMAIPGFFTPSETSWPGAPFAANDLGFGVASDGTPVYRNAPEAANTVCSWGNITPVIGRTYQVTATGRIKTAPTNGRPAIFQAGLLGLKSDGTGNIGYYADAPDVSATPVGTLITSTITHTYGGVTPQSAYKSRVLINFDGADGDAETGVFSDAVFELISLQLEDVTESTAAAGSASAALTSEQSASTSETGAGVYEGEAQQAYTLTFAAQNAAGQSALSAAGSYSDAQGEAGDALGSAQAAAGSALTAQGYSGDALGYAGDAHGSAVDAYGSAVSAADSAQLVANYNPGTNLVFNPSFSQGAAEWNMLNGSTPASDPTFGSFVDHPTYAADLGTNYFGIASTSNSGANPGDVYSIQGVILSAGISQGLGRVGLNFYNQAGANIGYAAAEAPAGAGWTRYTCQNIIAPAGTVAYDVLLDLYNPNGDLVCTGQPVGFTKIKLEPGAVCTPFTDDQIGASLSQVAAVAANDNGSTAYNLSLLQATVDDPTNGLAAAHADVSITQAAVAELNGQVTGMLKLSTSTDTDGNTSVTSLELLNSQGGASPVNAVKITALQLLLVNALGDLLFGVDGNTNTTYMQNVVIDGSLFVRASVDTTQLAPGAVSAASYSVNNNATDVYVPGSSATAPTPPSGGGGGSSGGGGGGRTHPN